MSEVEELEIDKVSEYFKSTPFLKREDLRTFMIKTDLVSLFETIESQDNLWNIMMRFTEGREEVDIEACKNTLLTIFKINNNDIGEPQSKRNSEVFNLSIGNILKSADQKIDRRFSLSFNGDASFDISNNFMLSQEKKRLLFSLMTQMTLNQFEEFRKILSLVSLKSTNFISMVEIKELIEKYSITYFTQRDVITLLIYLTEDNFEYHDSIDHLLINKRLCEETIRKVDNSLNIVNYNSNIVNETNCVSQIPLETVEEFMKIVNNTDSYLHILKEYCSQIFSIISNELTVTLDNDFEGKTEGARGVIEAELEQIVFKMKNIEFFANHWKKNFGIFIAKLESLKNTIINYEEKIQHFDNMNEQPSNLSNLLPISNVNDMNELISQINKENEILTNTNEENLLKINTLSLALIDKDKVICNFTEKNEELIEKNSEILKQLDQYTNLYKQMKYQYDLLLSDTFKKQEKNSVKYIKEDEDNPANKDDSTPDTIDEADQCDDGPKSTKTAIRRLKSVMHLNDNVKSLICMNYDDLIKYTVNCEKTIKELELNIKEKDEAIAMENKKTEQFRQKVEKLKEKNYKLREQNCILYNTNVQLKKANECSEQFRPSNILNNFLNASNNHISTDKIQCERDKTHLSDIESSEKKKKINNLQSSMDMTIDNNNINVNINSNSNQAIIFNPVRLSVLDDSFDGDKTKKKKLENNNDLTQNNIIILDGEGEDINAKDTNRISFGFTLKDTEKRASPVHFLNKKDNYDEFNLSVIEEENNKVKLSKTNEFFVIEGKEKQIEKEKEKENLKEKGYSRSQCESFQIHHGDFSFYEKKQEEDETPKKSIKFNEFNSFSFKNSKGDSNKFSQNFHSERPANSNQVFNITYNNSFNHVTIFEPNDSIASESKKISIISKQDDIVLKNEDPIISPIEEKKVSLGNHINQIEINNTNESYEDITIVLPRESNINNYDFISMKQKSFKKLSDHLKDENIKEIFSFNINFFENIEKKVRRTILITSNHFTNLDKNMYIMKSDTLEFSSKHCLKNLNKVTVSNKNPNLIAFHFVDENDILIEIVKRTELLLFLRDSFNKNKKQLFVRFSESFKIMKNKESFFIFINQLNKMFIAPNYENAQKLGYLDKYYKGLFGGGFREKFLVLTDIGLLYFDDPTEKQPKSLIPIFGSDIYEVEEMKYKKPHCFEIKTVSQEIFVFSGKNKEETASWLKEFSTFQNRYEAKLKSVGISSKKKK